MNLSENLRERPKFVTEPKRILIPATKKKLEVNISNRLINIFIEGEENFVGDSEIIALGGASNETKDRPLG